VEGEKVKETLVNQPYEFELKPRDGMGITGHGACDGSHAYVRAPMGPW